MQATTKKQTELIDFYKRMKGEQEAYENLRLYAHYEHLFFSLRKIIESYGPTPECQDWLNSI